MHAMTSTPDELLRAGAGAAARALAAGQLRAIDLCDAAIARIEADDGALNAVVVRDFERARAQAAEADAALARGERRPLLGVPMTVKESFDLAGLPTCWGIPELREYRATEDAVAVQKLKAAGAVVLGKTNVPPGLGDWQSGNPVYGRTVNPFDAGRSPGGSSGGGAAALAAGMVALELGSDIGGSLRVPAHFCGVYSHKPSLGLLSGRGHAPAGAQGAPGVLAVIGPLARTAADLDLTLGLLAGPDGMDPFGAPAWRLELPAPRHAGARGARVLVLTEHPSAKADRAVRDAVERAAEALQAGGARLSRSTPLLPELGAQHEVYHALLIASISRGNPHMKCDMSAHEWLTLLDRRHALRRQWQALFREFDAVLCPPFGTPAFPHIESPNSHSTLDIDGQATPYFAQSAWAGIATLPGLPSTTVPMGRTAQGLPVGVQLIGPYMEDRTPIALAAALAS